VNHFNKHIVKTNRKESFWFHAIRAINYFCYRFWWLILSLLLISLLVFLLVLRKVKNNPVVIARNPIAMLDSLSLNLDKCCINIPPLPKDSNQIAYLPIPTSPQPPQENCRVFFSGLTVWAAAVGPNSEIYKIDHASEYVGAGEYPDNTKAFPKAVQMSFDGIAIDAKTRLIIYSKKNFTGIILLDTVGPIIINNVLFKNDPAYRHCNYEEFPAPYTETYSPAHRIWSKSDMTDWSYGSCKIMCRN